MRCPIPLYPVVVIIKSMLGSLIPFDYNIVYSISEYLVSVPLLIKTRKLLYFISFVAGIRESVHLTLFTF